MIFKVEIEALYQEGFIASSLHIQCPQGTEKSFPVHMVLQFLNPWLFPNIDFLLLFIMHVGMTCYFSPYHLFSYIHM